MSRVGLRLFSLITLAPAASSEIRQTNDAIGFGYTWSDPADQALDDEGAIDAYYRVQVTPEISISPVLQVVFDPVRNPDENTVFVWGIRVRVNL
jgi:porin